MEEALLLILTSSFSPETLEKIRHIKGVVTAQIIYGPYDLFVTIKTKDREELREVVMKIREIQEIKSTVTCNVIPPL
jgi:DNA-binding Lrp family transcriptional regulator